LECGGKVPIYRDGDTALDRSKAPSPQRYGRRTPSWTRPLPLSVLTSLFKVM
jgi:hypothetical protein